MAYNQDLPPRDNINESDDQNDYIDNDAQEAQDKMTEEQANGGLAFSNEDQAIRHRIRPMQQTEEDEDLEEENLEDEDEDEDELNVTNQERLEEIEMTSVSPSEAVGFAFAPNSNTI